MSHNAEDDDDDDDMAELFSFGIDESGETSSGAIGHESSADEATAASLRARSNSDDSLIDMIESEGVKSVVSGGGMMEDHDTETQDILNWLDTEDDHTATDLMIERHASQEEEEEEALPGPPPAEPTVVALPPVFASLQEALDSKESTSEQIRQLALAENLIPKVQRVELYCRLVCNKTLEETLSSSLADSFEHWTQNAVQDDTASDEPTVVAFQTWSKELAHSLAEKFGCEENELLKLLKYQLRSHGTEQDPLIPPVAATLLATGMPAAACSVVLHQLIPSYMPLLHLPPVERWEASLSMHCEFYLLAVYHLPLLVFHLDRYLPGWQWPKKQHVDQATPLEPTQKGRNLTSHGQLPASWLLSHFAGECNGTLYLTLSEVLDVWDQTFTRKDSALRFFLTLALLEQAADTLLLLTGDALKENFESALKINESNADKPIRYWVDRAEALCMATPDTVLTKLRTAEDSAVQHTLKLRQERAERDLKAKMEAESLAHKTAQEKRADEARERLSRARLVAFYRKHMPEKEDNVDTILVNYTGRLDVLEKKLKAKYGEGFNPAFKPKKESDLPKEAFKLLASMNTGIGNRTISQKEENDSADHSRSPEQVSVLVAASEVLPLFCWSKEASAARGVEHKRIADQKNLKFYIVDSRTEAAAIEQGRFPTSMNLSPETMMDPEKLKDAEERFESLRGAAHIVVMGDGFSALPELYDYKLNPRTEELIVEDQSRMQLCALFFVKRGFPFVSVLNGGYAACHSWLVRDGPKHGLKASAVLSDYVPDGSLFGQLETFHNASGAEKAQRRMQAILDKSLTVVAKRAQQLENFANDLDNVEPSAAGFRGLFGRGLPSANKTAAPASQDEIRNDAKENDKIRNLFAGINKSFDEERKKMEDVHPLSKSPVVSSADEDLEASNQPADHDSKVDVKAEQKAKVTAATNNAFANLWRRGATPGGAAPASNVSADKPVTSASAEQGGGIGGFLKRSTFARFGNPAPGAGPSSPKPSTGTTVLAPVVPVKGNQDTSQVVEETVTFSNPGSDVKEEVMFEIGDTSEPMDKDDPEETDVIASQSSSKAEVEQV